MRALQPLEVLLGIVEPVGMVDAESVNLAFAQESEYEFVGLVEDKLRLLSQGSEVVDVEKAPVIDVVGGNPPIGEAIGLRLDQLVQGIERGGIAGFPVHFSNALFEKVCNLGRSFAHRG